MQQNESEETTFYRPADMPALLRCSRSTYYRVVADGHLPYARLYPGGPRIHLPEHIDAYRKHLLDNSTPKLAKTR
jgi:hypothetical protein